jgi:AcrR family transcriptional regulator
MPQPTGLRDRKKARTRARIAAAAARLFAERGYEQVTVGEVARASEVATQTVYNYFPTKADLVTDRDSAVQARLSALIRERPPDTSPARAIRPLVLAAVEAIPEIPPDQWRGEIGHLALVSATVHRLSLEMTDRQADVAAQAILETSDVTPAVAQMQGMALAGLFQLMFAECGRRTRDRQPQPRIADELTEIMTEVLDELDRWFDRRES